MTQLTFTQGSAEWHAYRKRALNDLFWLADVVLGYGSLVPLTVPTHRLMVKFAERKTGSPLLDDAHYRMVSVPRGVGKTAAITICKVIQDSLRDPDGSTLLGNEKQDNANLFLSEIKTHFESNEFLRALFPDIIPAEPKRMEPWSATAMNLIRKSSRKEPTIFTIGVGGTVTGMHPDRIICDDVISREAMENARAGSWQIMEKTNRWINQLTPLLNYSAPWWEIVFIGCVAEHEPVLMADGTWKEIRYIQVGELVASWDDKARRFKGQLVTGVWPQGVTPTVTVKTQRHTVVVTPTHPFLTDNGYVQAHSLRKGQRVYTVGSLTATQHGRKTMIPGWRQASKDRLWLLGYLWGDGWVTKHVGKTSRRGTSWCVCAAMGVYPELNARVKSLLEREFKGRLYQTDFGYVRMDNNKAARTLDALGLTAGVRAPDKVLPEWLFRMRPAEKRSFLRGLLAADGHAIKRSGGFALSTASKALADGVRLLSMTCGVRPSRVFHRSRMSKAPHSSTERLSHEYSLNLKFEPRRELRGERITSVTVDGERRTYDLSVANTQNFVAAGYCVHNTRWWMGDSYEHIERAFGYGETPQRVRLKQQLEDGSTQVLDNVYRVGDLAVFKRAIIENGACIFPEKFTMEDLAKLRIRDPELYAANYLNEPSTDLTATLKQGWLRYFQWANTEVVRCIGPEGKDVSSHVQDLDCIISVDPAFSEGQDSKSRQALIVTGTNEDGLHFMLQASATKQSVEAFIVDIVGAVKKFRPRKLLIERAGQQIAFIMLVKERLASEGLSTVVEEVTPGGRKKEVRIQTLEPYFQRGTIYIARDQLDFLHEYSTFPRGEYKDLLDALAYQLPYWRTGIVGRAQPANQQRADAEVQRLYQRMGVTGPAASSDRDGWRRRADGSMR